MQDLILCEVSTVALIHSDHDLLRNSCEALGTAVVIINHAGSGLGISVDDILALILLFLVSDQLAFMMIKCKANPLIKRQIGRNIVL